MLLQSNQFQRSLADGSVKQVESERRRHCLHAVGEGGTDHTSGAHCTHTAVQATLLGHPLKSASVFGQQQELFPLPCRPPCKP